ncbi:Hpt domain-containing protein [Vibrio sp. WJH972]
MESLENQFMALINKDTLDQLANDIGEESVPMLLDIFLGEIGDYINTLSSVGSPDVIVQLGEISHALKSSAASFGADKLCRFANEIDSMVKINKSIEGEVQPFIELLKQTHTAYSTLRQES